MAMTIEFHDGQPVIDAAQIAPLLDLDLTGFQVLMRSGRIRTAVEQGAGEDEGKLRLTFRSPQWRVRLTCTGDGTVLTTTRIRMEPTAAEVTAENGRQ